MLIIIVVLAVVVFCATQGLEKIRLQQALHRLERKLDAVLKHQGIELPPSGVCVSPEVRLMAQNSRQKIVAIKLHRDQNPALSLAEAKKDVEACVSIH